MRRFEAARKAAEVSVTEVVRRSGLSRTTVFTIQAGSRIPSYGTALKLASAIEADPREIVELAPAVETFEQMGATA